MKIILKDKVQVLSGKDRGRQGEVIRSSPKTNEVVVKGLNMYKKHVKPSNGQKGGIVEKERALTVSKVALVCPKCQKITRVGYQIDKSGQKYRVCKKCQAMLVANTK